MRHRRKFPYILLAVAAAPVYLLLQPSQAVSAADQPAPGHGQELIVSFRSASIEANAAHRLTGQAAPFTASDPNLAALPARQVRPYLRSTGRAFTAEKSAVIAAHPGVRLVKSFSLLPTAVVRVSGAAAEAALAADPRVLSVSPNARYTEPAAASTPDSSSPADLSVIDDVKAQAAGDLGEGTVAAVLDDGTNYKASAFGDCSKIGTAKCAVLAYKDFGTKPAKDLSFTGHGTNVAGQVLKVAPDAKLVIGNVFTAEGKDGSTSSTAEIMSGLNWVLTEESENAVKYAFRAVNLSLGTRFSYYTTACTSSPYAAVFSQLLSVNIQPVVAAGNTAYDGTKYTDGIGTPACAPGALAVGAAYSKNIGKAVWDQKYGSKDSDCTDKTTKAGQVACFSQGGPLVGVLAPGVKEKAAGITDTGTSQATPLVTGAIAALASGSPSQSAIAITSAIESSGKKITDARTKLDVPLLDVYAAEAKSYGGAVISSGNVGLGIAQWGDLNIPNESVSASGTTAYGLRYLPTGNDFAGPGCLCEGWGVADTGTGADGYADEYTGDAGQTLIRFSHSPTTATSTVRIGGKIQVTNAYSPVSKVPDLYQDQVVIKNISKATLANIVYRRLVDWDMEPTAFHEYVTVQGFGNSAKLVSTTNDGFDSADPLSASDNLGATGNFVQYGPLDQGCQFNFDFGAIKAGKTFAFTEYYGAAASQAAAYADLKKIGAEAYSLGEPDENLDGTPNTAMLAFTGIGGTPLTYPPAA